jgi:hypothetical protein
MKEIYLDKSRNVRLRARIGEASVPRVFKFRTKDEITGETSPHNISGYDFELIVFKRANSLVRLFTLTIGDGLSINDGSDEDEDELTVEISEERAAQRADTNFWRLRSKTEDHTWLNGPFEFHNGENDAMEAEEVVKIYHNG